MSRFRWYRRLRGGFWVLWNGERHGSPAPDWWERFDSSWNCGEPPTHAIRAKEDYT